MAGIGCRCAVRGWRGGPIASSTATPAIFGFPATATNAANLRLAGFAALLAALLMLAAPWLRRRTIHGLAY